MPDTCIACGSRTFGKIKKVDAKDGKPIYLSTCEACGLVQLCDVPDETDLSRFYREEYRKSYRKSDTPKPRHIFRAGHLASERLSRLNAHVAPGKRLLDVGAGGGEFVYLAGQAGFDAMGVDPSSGYLEFARTQYGVNVLNDGYNSAQIKGTFDVVTLFHVLEHLPDPKTTIRDLSLRLNTGGILFIEVPNLGSKNVSPSNMFFKAHISYFSPNSLQLLVMDLFDVVEENDGRVLQMVLRKKDDDLGLNEKDDLKTKSQKYSQDRLSKIGYREYLANGGWMSFFSSAKRIFREKRGTAGRTARSILDDFHRAKPH